MAKVWQEFYAECDGTCRDCGEIASCPMRVLFDVEEGGTQSEALADLVAALDFTLQSNTFDCIVEELGETVVPRQNIREMYTVE